MLEFSRAVKVYLSNAPLDYPFILNCLEYGELFVEVMPNGALRIFTLQGAPKGENEWIFASGSWDSVFSGMTCEEIPD